MANQGYDRRMVLQLVAKAAVASQFPGFSKWVFGAQEHEHEGEHNHVQTPTHKPPYRPAYFSDSEYRTIEVLTDLIIPADETPGAKAAGVCEFIDFMAAHGEREIQQPMRDGLARLDAFAQKSYEAAFERLSPERQTQMLRAMASKSSSEEERAFFLLIRKYTVMGYYTSRIGLEELDFPGLRLYTKSPACPHTNDPEHLHLRSARI